MKKFDVVTLGEVLIDFVNNGVSEQGNNTFEACPGGAVSNVVAMLAKLGKKCAFIGKVGDDIFGRRLKNELELLSINTDNIKMDKNVAVETSALNVVLSGQVNLPNQTMSVSMEPTLPSGTNNNLLNASRLIKIDGSFTKPKITLDTQKAIQAGIDKGIEKGLNKLSEKMGVDVPLEELASTMPTQPQPLSLCETALGHKLRGKVTITLPKVQEKPAVPVKKEKDPKEEEQLPPEEILKKQLIQSLKSAVQ